VFVKILVFLLILILGAMTGFLYQDRNQKERQIQGMQQETSRLRKKITHLEKRLEQKQSEIAELKIQAVIKDSGGEP